MSTYNHFGKRLSLEAGNDLVREVHIDMAVVDSELIIDKNPGRGRW